MQEVAQAFEFGDQLLDFRKRGAGNALDQRIDVVDGGLGVRLERRGFRARDGRAAQIGNVVADEVADPRLDFGDRSKIAVDVGVVSRFNFFRTNGSALRLILSFALTREVSHKHASADIPRTTK